MKKKLLKGTMCLSLIGLLSVPQQANAIFSVPMSEIK